MEGVVPPAEGMALHEDSAHLLSSVLELKPYYMGSLHVEESLFTALQREGSLEGEREREEVRWGSQWCL